MRTLGVLAPEAIAIEEEVSREPHESLVLLIAHTIRSHNVGKPLFDEGKLAIGIQVSLSTRNVAVRDLAFEIASGGRWDRRVVRENGDNGRGVGSQGDGTIDHVRERIELVNPVLELAMVLLDWRVARLSRCQARTLLGA